MSKPKPSTKNKDKVRSSSSVKLKAKQESCNSNNTKKKLKSKKDLERDLKMKEISKYDSKQYISGICRAISTRTFVNPIQAHLIPRRRVVKIMKLDPSVPHVSNEAVELMALATQLFVTDLSRRSFKLTYKRGKKTIALVDMCKAVESDHIFDFLIDIIPRYDSDGSCDEAQYQQNFDNIGSELKLRQLKTSE